MKQLLLTAQQPRCIDLTPEQSAKLGEACGGEFGQCFVVTARQTYPGDPQRWRLWIVPCTAKQANQAIARIKKQH